MSQSELKTLFDLEDILKRASDEYFTSRRQQDPAMRLLSPVELQLSNDYFNYLARTAIGELHEFEVLRKLRPLVRSMKSLASDCEFLDQNEASQTSQTRRIK